mgnify:FL=1
MIGDMESTLLIDAAYRANFDLPQIPEPDGSYVLNQKLWYVYKEKARESVPVTHPALWGLRIAHPVRTSNAEAHADMYNLNTSLTSKDETRTLTYRADTYCCFVCGRVRNLRSFKEPRTKRQVNVFSIYMYFPLSHTSLTEVSAWKTRQRYGIINRIENNSHFLYPWISFL